MTPEGAHPIVEEPLFFQYDGARLFSVVHAAHAPATDVGVVLCHPYAEERQLTDRILVHFGRQLAAAGFGALRFDCRGYGESQGELQDSALETQIAETLAAAALLRGRLRLQSVVLLGLRWGATVAALAAERDPGIAGVVLWSPILSGRAYARELLRGKLAGQLALEDGSATREQILETLQVDGRIEFEGGYLTRRMFEDVSAIDLPHQVGRFRKPVFVSTIQRRNRNYDAYDALVSAYRLAGARADLVVAEEREYGDVRSMFDGVFPDRLYTATLDWMRSRWPGRS